MTDKELLELAAKAADEGIVFYGECLRAQTGREWNPLTDDGDALRLAVKLGLNLEIRKHYPAQTQIMTRNKEESLHGFYVGISETHDNDPYAATRRAIVRAAAEIGKTL